MDTFQASVQYDDFKGSSAADRADEISLRDYLVEEGIASKDERIVGHRMCFSENHGQEIVNPGLVVYLAPVEEAPKTVRAIELDMPASQWFKYFKRLDIVFTAKGTDLSGAEVEGPNFD